MWFSWLKWHLVYQKVEGSISVQSTYPGCRFDSWRVRERDNWPMLFSLSPFLFLKSTNKIFKKTRVSCAIELMMPKALPVLKVIASSLHGAECHTEHWDFFTEIGQDVGLGRQFWKTKVRSHTTKYTEKKLYRHKCDIYPLEEWNTIIFRWMLLVCFVTHKPIRDNHL